MTTSRTVTILLHGAPLAVSLTEEEWTAYCRDEDLHAWRVAEWRRCVAALNAAPPAAPAEIREETREPGFGLYVAAFCLSFLAGAALLLRFLN